MKQPFLLLSSIAIFSSMVSFAQQGDPKATEFYTPVPPVVSPGKTNTDAPSDAIILFDGKNLDQWVSTKDTSKPAGWKVAKGIITVDKSTGNIQTKKFFYRLPVAYRMAYS